ncbi:MAG: KamA family radical SAM protein [bacterium]|nr:MAG: KamA family radical SAM protein [bacterium]
MEWQEELQRSICDVERLKDLMSLSRRQEAHLKQIIKRHPMRITRYYASLIDWTNPSDPLMRMVVPDTGEMNLSGSYVTSGESLSTKMRGLQHKYRETALILATSRCPQYCRHCFRKRLVGLPTEEVLQRFADAARYIEQHREINNVLISGGDPLMLSTAILRNFLNKLLGIPHLAYVRIGTRSPVSFPDRILKDGSLVELLRKHTSMWKRLYVVTQYNHPAEITEPSVAAVNKLRDAGTAIINQTVLLRGVNDDPDTLADLLHKLTKIGVCPYYVFQCRSVKRVKRRFQIPLAEGYRIVEKTKSMLDGPSKRFRYVMSHRNGKIEIIGIMGNEIYFKYHQARDPKNIGRFFKRKLVPDAGWLDDLKQTPVSADGVVS